MNALTNLNLFSFELFSLTYRRVRSSFFLALRLHIFVLNCSVFIVNSATPLRHLCRPAIKRKVCRFCFDRSRVINFDHHSWLTGAISRSAPRPVSWGVGRLDGIIPPLPIKRMRRMRRSPTEHITPHHPCLQNDPDLKGLGTC